VGIVPSCFESNSQERFEKHSCNSAWHDRDIPAA
jgi:hypothetical protein